MDTWLTASAGCDPDIDQLTSLLTGALRALWDRAQPAVGDIILATVLRRAIRSAERRNEAAAELGLRVSDRGIFTIAHVPSRPTDLADAVDCVLVEILQAVATLTADALTPALHAALRSVMSEITVTRRSPRPPAARDDLLPEVTR